MEIIIDNTLYDENKIRWIVKKHHNDLIKRKETMRKKRAKPMILLPEPIPVQDVTSRVTSSPEPIPVQEPIWVTSRVTSSPEPISVQEPISMISRVTSSPEPISVQEPVKVLRKRPEIKIIKSQIVPEPEINITSQHQKDIDKINDTRKKLEKLGIFI